MSKKQDCQLLWLAGMALLHQRREVPGFWLYLPGILWWLLWGGYAGYLIYTGTPMRRFAYFGMWRRNRPRDAHFEPPQPSPTNWLRAAGVALLLSGVADFIPKSIDPSLHEFTLIFIFLPLYLIGIFVSYRSRHVL